MSDFRRKPFKKILIDIKNFNVKNDQVIKVLLDIKKILLKKIYQKPIKLYW